VAAKPCNNASRSRVHLPLIGLHPRHQFSHFLYRFIMSTTSSAVVTTVQNRLGLKKIPPYWYPYTTNAKQRWINREILEIVSTEFRDRSLEYYVRSRPSELNRVLIDLGRMQRYALECGVTTINGKIAKPDTVVQDGDRIELRLAHAPEKYA
jgi:hypothetical protein